MNESVPSRGHLGLIPSFLMFKRGIEPSTYNLSSDYAKPQSYLKRF